MAHTNSDASHGCSITATGVACPTCQQGTLEPKRGRFGPVYACTNTKDCTTILTARPTGARCSYPHDGQVCGHLIVAGTKTIPDRCSDKTCPNRNPHKLERVYIAVSGGPE